MKASAARVRSSCPSRWINWGLGTVSLIARLVRLLDFRIQYYSTKNLQNYVNSSPSADKQFAPFHKVIPNTFCPGELLPYITTHSNCKKVHLEILKEKG